MVILFYFKIKREYYIQTQLYYSKLKNKMIIFLLSFLLLLFVFSSFPNVKSASFYFGGLPESKSMRFRV